MDNLVIIWSLKIVINASALLCVLRGKNKVLHIVLECIFCMIMLILPIFALSFLVYIFNGNNSVDIWNVIKYVNLILGGGSIFFILSNWKCERKFEDYMLLRALYIQEYLKDKKRIRKQKITLVFEFLQFIFIYFILLCGIISLIGTLKGDSVSIIFISMVLALAAASVLFVYGKWDEEIRKNRKAMLGILITVIWSIVVYIRISQYRKDITQLGFEDIILLLCSVIFTIPTILGWIKSIPTKLMEPYEEIVNNRRTEIIAKYVAIMIEGKECGDEILKKIKDVCIFLREEWRYGQKKKIFKMCACIIVIIIVMIFILVIANLISNIINELVMEIKHWYANLNYEIRAIIEKSALITFIAGIMSFFVYRAPRTFKEKNTNIEKIKYIVVLIMVEVCFSFSLYIILFSN